MAKTIKPQPKVVRISGRKYNYKSNVNLTILDFNENNESPVVDDKEIVKIKKDKPIRDIKLKKKVIKKVIPVPVLIEKTIGYDNTNAAYTKRKEREKILRRYEEFLANYKQPTLHEIAKDELNKGNVPIKLNTRTTIFVKKEKCKQNKMGEWELLEKREEVKDKSMVLRRSASKTLKRENITSIDLGFD